MSALDQTYGVNVTRTLAEAVARLRLADIPAEAVRVARYNLLDCTGVAVEGAGEESAAIVRRFALTLGGGGSGVIWGRPERTSPAAAALANGMAAHALDFDDANQSITGHPTAPIWPAVLAVAQARGASGAEALTGYIAGLEVAGKIGRVVNPRHQEAGWHPTATLCTLGAAAGCARVMGLDGEATARALAIAVSLASGVRRNFGTMVKALHAGMAAFHGVTAAFLAAEGLTADSDGLSGETGFLGAFVPGPPPADWESVAAGWGERWEILDPGMDIKPYPCCRATHASIDCVLHLVKEHQIRPEQIVAIRAGVSYMRPKVLLFDRPRTPLEAKFSMPFCLAAAAVDGTVSGNHFSPAGMANPAIQALLPRAKMFVHPEMGPRPGVNPALELVGAEVTIELTDGRNASHRVKQGKGNPSVPMTEAEFMAKFNGCAKSLGTEVRDDIGRAILDLEHEASLDRLCSRLSTSAAAGH